MNQTLKTILNIAVYCAIIFGILYGVPKFLVWKLGTEFPMAAITSGSMWPILKEGDLVFIEAVKSENIKKGDIIVFQNKTNASLTIHRVVLLEETKITTKGDANFREDAPVGYEDVIGRTYDFQGNPLRIPYLGKITMFAGKWRDNIRAQEG